MTARSEQTKSKIQLGFAELLQEKSYEAITMAEVARRANRTRSTVYRHYEDKDALLLDCCNNIIEKLKYAIAYPKELPEQGVSPITYTNLLGFYAHVDQHRPLYKALFNSSIGPMVRRRFRRVLAGVLLHITEQAGSLHSLPAPSDMVCNLLAEVALGAAVWWLDADATYEPALLAEIVIRLSETGLFGLNGQTPVESDMSFLPFVMHERG
jgi:AcrR family transcriptional regulator